MAKEILARYYDQNMSSGVYYTEETGVLSIYEKHKFAQRVWNKAGDAVDITKERLNRFSLNLKTGACYTYTDAPRCRHTIRRKDYFPIGMAFSQMMLKIFAWKAIEVNRLPIVISPLGEYTWEIKLHHNAVSKDDPLKNSVFFNSMSQTIEDVGNAELLTIIASLVRCPNVYLVNDVYSDTLKFREEKPFGFLLEYGNDCYEHIGGRIPMTARFKKIQTPEILDEDDYLKKCIKATGVPASKTLMKYYRRNPAFIGFVDYLMSCGIKKTDNLVKMLPMLRWNIFWTSSMDRKFKKFIKASVAACGETNTVRKLSVWIDELDTYTTDNFLLPDTINSFNYLLEAKRKDMDIPMTGSLKELHDKYSVLYQELAHENREITPTKKEQKREFADESTAISIKLAEDTDRLFNIGNEMHICVGSYGDVAVDKKTTIYYMQDQTDKYVGCIEVKKNKLVQAKAFANGTLVGKPAETLKRWVDTMQINANNCWDYKHCEPELVG